MNTRNDETGSAIFRWLWPPGQATDAPLTRHRERLPARGPLALALLVPLTVFILATLPALVLAAVATGGWLAALTSCLLTALLVAGLLRAWGRGTYVNHRGYVIRRLLTSDRGQWADVVRIRVDRGCLVLDLTNRRTLRTQAGPRTLDTLFRPEAADIAELRLRDLWQAEWTAAVTDHSSR